MISFLRKAVIGLVTVAVVSMGFVAPASASGAAFESDDFSKGVLDARWSIVDPVGDGAVGFVGAGTADARLSLSVPGGTNHDPWNSNRSLRVMQSAADIDFQAEARWTTVPSLKYQAQGLLVQQDAGNWLRFDVHSTGSALRVFAARTVNGTSKSLLVKGVVPGTEVGLRVTRVGSAWTLEYSAGSGWTTAGTVQHALAVTSIGPFVGNSGPNPAFTSQVDYVMDTAAPIVEENGVPAATYEMSTTVVGQGAVLRSPDASSYVSGTVVELTASPAAGWYFTGWSGDASGTAPVISITMETAKSVTATFTESPTQPPPEGETYSLTVSVQGQGVVKRSPTGDRFGADTVVSLTAQPAAGWKLAGWSGDVTGSSATVDVVMDADKSVTAAFVESTTQAPVLVSDDFSAGLLDTQVWSVVDPVGDGAVSIVGAGTNDMQLALSLPGGVAHDAFNSNRSLRVVQAVPDVDFEVASRFTSSPSLKYQIQGLLVEQDARNWMRFDVHSTGTGTRLYIGKTVDGKTSRMVQRSITTSDEVTLRLNRSGDVWTLDFSPDNGVTWLTGGQATHTLAPTVIGPFAGNGGDKPAFTALVDWFFDTSNPVVPEDGATVETFPLTVETVGQGSVSRSPSASSYPAGTEVTLTASPSSGWEFVRWSGAVSGTEPQTTVAMSGATTVTVTFEERPPAPSSPPVIDVWYGLDQTFGSSGTPQAWVNLLGNVSDSDGVASLTYSLNGSPAKNLRLGSDLRRLYLPGDFNVQLVEADLPLGASTVVLRAVDNAGDTSTTSVVVRRATGTALLPHVVDWSTAARPGDVAQVVDGKWSLTSGGLTVSEMGYDRTVAIGDQGWTDYEVTVPVTVRGLGDGAGTPQSGVPLVGLGLHWDGHHTRTTEEPAGAWWPTGAYAWHEWYGSGRFTLQGNDGSPLVRKSMTWDFGTTYVMKARVETETEGVRYSYKWWPQGTTEPAVWALNVLEDAGPGEGSVLLIAHHVDATFGTVRVEPL